MSVLPRPPLHGFDLRPVPTDRVPYLAIELQREAKLWKRKGNGWPLLTAKLHERSDHLLADWRRRAEARS